MPWLKLAVFGEKRSEKNCLRTNANTQQITGIEVEYDKGEIPFDTAVAVLRTARLRALLYTSPSYVPAAKERWRILLPLSSKQPPDARRSLVARVNGLFNGKLAPESFNLSLAYLYGSVNDNPAHRVEVVDGDFIDLRSDLDPGAIGKSAKPDARADTGRRRPECQAASDGAPRTDEELHQLLEATRLEGKWHENMLLVTATLIGRGYPDSKIKLICAPYFNDRFADKDFAGLLDGARKKWGKPNEEAQARTEVDDELARLAGLSVFDYERQRKDAAKALGVRGPALDSMVGAWMRRNQTEAKATDSEIAKLNADHALVLAGNKAAVMKFEGASAIKFRLLQVDAFKLWHANRIVMAGRNAVSLGEYWLAHPQRRQYGGIEFAPPGSVVPPGYYNLFQGFAVKPKPGDCSKFLAHLKDNVARGDEKTFLWIVGWWAQIFQQPSIKMETALVTRGPFGTGKTKIGKVMGSLIGDGVHYLLVDAPRYITGQFNSHMASLLVLHADEAFWAGDKASVGTLRSLVSGDHHMLEYKNINPIYVKNHIRLYVSGDPDWVVPAGFKERRWAVFDMGQDHIQDHDYFAAIDREMDNGGREALLHYLLNFELSQVNLRVIPKTAALLAQQIESMTPEQAWWFETLHKGVLPYSPQGINEPWVCRRDDLFEQYIRHAQLRGVSHRAIETKIGMFLGKQLGAELKSTRPTVNGQQLRCYAMPPLNKCRQLFSKEIGQPVDWGSEEWESEEWQQGSGWSHTSKLF